MLRIEHLTKKYGDKKAVDNLSLHIQKGEIIFWRFILAKFKRKYTLGEEIFNGLYISSKTVSVIQISQIYWFVIQTC